MLKAGDLMYCTFGPQGMCVLLSRHEHNAMFWNILWNGQTCLMHTDHLVAA